MGETCWRRRDVGGRLRRVFSIGAISSLVLIAATPIAAQDDPGAGQDPAPREADAEREDDAASQRLALEDGGPRDGSSGAEASREDAPAIPPAGEEGPRGARAEAANLENAIADLRSRLEAFDRARAARAPLDLPELQRLGPERSAAGRCSAEEARAAELEAALAACEQTTQRADAGELIALEATVLIEESAAARLAVAEAQNAQLRAALDDAQARLVELEEELARERAGEGRPEARAPASGEDLALLRARARLAVFASPEQKALLAQRWMRDFAAAQEAGGWRLRLEEDDLFAEGQARLADAAIDNLSKLAALIAHHDDKAVRLIADGGAGEALGRERAVVVARFLNERLGVASGRIRAAGADPEAGGAGFEIELIGP